MKTTKLPLAKWQALLHEYCATFNRTEPFPCFRIDGTQFSLGIFYGAFDYNGVRYTVVDPAEDGAYLAISPMFLAWVTKRKEPKPEPKQKAKQTTLQLQ